MKITFLFIFVLKVPPHLIIKGGGPTSKHHKKSECWAMCIVKKFMSTLFRMVIGSTKKKKGKRVIS